ncbi:MAG: CRISPR-associated endonuclease Cas2 [Bacteroidetes bacterium]|nr:CRISPR-associated endonuclease Cas2 [Bacteroidota bacterium]MCW5896720.1 CRISPR-associated endonuclease Cas2 [Bacteroidota bacterium]
MYVIVVYDVEEKRVAKVLKFLRRYLHWVQNSVFEGELTEGKFKEMQAGLRKHIKPEKDSVLFYKMRSDKDFEKEVMGLEKAGTETML